MNINYGFIIMDYCAGSPLVFVRWALVA